MATWSLPGTPYKIIQLLLKPIDYNEWGELNCPISVGYHLDLHIAIISLLSLIFYSSSINS